ncbi:MAG: TetR/AcrR family transcriptional regulator [Cyanobacteria bacterium J06638_20]
MPKIVDHDHYRKELLNQCSKLFAEQGYGSITMRQIAQGLGVSTGTLYHYFPSKEGIFIQLIQETCERDVANFFAQAPSAATLQERLTTLMTFFLKGYKSYQQKMLLWVDFYQHGQRNAAENPSYLGQFWRKTRDQLMTYLELPAERVDFILVFMDGLLVQCIYDHGHDEAAWLAEQSELLIRLLTAK